MDYPCLGVARPQRVLRAAVLWGDKDHYHTDVGRPYLWRRGPSVTSIGGLVLFGDGTAPDGAASCGVRRTLASVDFSLLGMARSQRVLRAAVLGDDAGRHRKNQRESLGGTPTASLQSDANDDTESWWQRTNVTIRAQTGLALLKWDVPGQHRRESLGGLRWPTSKNVQVRANAGLLTHAPNVWTHSAHDYEFVLPYTL